MYVNVFVLGHNRTQFYIPITTAQTAQMTHPKPKFAEVYIISEKCLREVKPLKDNKKNETNYGLH